MEWDVVVVGSINTDFMIRGPKLPTPGETALGEEFHEGPGGKGANQAVAAAHSAPEPPSWRSSAATVAATNWPNA